MRGPKGFVKMLSFPRVTFATDPRAARPHVLVNLSQVLVSFKPRHRLLSPQRAKARGLFKMSCEAEQQKATMLGTRPSQRERGEGERKSIGLGHPNPEQWASSNRGSQLALLQDKNAFPQEEVAYKYLKMSSQNTHGFLPGGTRVFRETYLCFPLATSCRVRYMFNTPLRPHSLRCNALGPPCVFMFLSVSKM